MWETSTVANFDCWSQFLLLILNIDRVVRWFRFVHLHKGFTTRRINWKLPASLPAIFASFHRRISSHNLKEQAILFDYFGFIKNHLCPGWLTNKHGPIQSMFTSCRYVALIQKWNCNPGLGGSANPIVQWSSSNFSCSLTSNKLRRTIWRTWLFIAYSDWKMIILPILTVSLTNFSLKRLGECTFWAWEWKG